MWDSEGSQETLPDKAFSAWCNKVPVNPDLEHNEKWSGNNTK